MVLLPLLTHVTSDTWTDERLIAHAALPKRLTFRRDLAIQPPPPGFWGFGFCGCGGFVCCGGVSEGGLLAGGSLGFGSLGFCAPGFCAPGFCGWLG